MGQSTDGIICYGYLLGEVSFPWDDDEHAGDIDNWWAYGIHGESYKPQHKSPFDAKGNWDAAQGFFNKRDRRHSEDSGQEAAYKAWSEERDAHKAALPELPVEFVNSCHCEHPVWIAAVPDTVMNARRGYPEEFIPSSLAANMDHVEEFEAFLREYMVPYIVEDCDDSFELPVPSWYLGSYWG